jgi:hypothetical protein
MAALRPWQVAALDQSDPEIEAGLDSMVAAFLAAQRSGATELEAFAALALRLGHSGMPGAVASIAATAIRRLSRLEGEKGRSGS